MTDYKPTSILINPGVGKSLFFYNKNIDQKTTK